MDGRVDGWISGTGKYQLLFHLSLISMDIKQHFELLSNSTVQVSSCSPSGEMVGILKNKSWQGQRDSSDITFTPHWASPPVDTVLTCITCIVVFTFRVYTRFCDYFPPVE